MARIKGPASGLCCLYRVESPGEALEVLARSITLDPRWQSREGRKLVVTYQRDKLLLTAFGTFQQADLTRLGFLARQIEWADRASRYVTYEEAEQACESLAEKLKRAIGPREIRQFKCVAIPRGGLIVQGMLSYALNLPAAAMNLDPGSDAPALVVDDCSISGLRFKQTLEKLSASKVVFAPLFSHPDLRRAILEREARVNVCLSGADLIDLAPESHGKDYAQWVENWRGRPGGDAYWIGQSEYLCFAWSEPESSFWNPQNEEMETGWKLVPPESCLRRRAEHGTPVDNADKCGAGQIEVQPAPAGPLIPAQGVSYVRLDAQSVAVAMPDSKTCFRMDDVAADMWLALVEYGDIEKASAALAQDYSADRERIARDMNSFVDELRGHGLLTGFQA